MDSGSINPQNYGEYDYLRDQDAIHKTIESLEKQLVEEKRIVKRLRMDMELLHKENYDLKNEVSRVGNCGIFSGDSESKFPYPVS